MSKLALRRMWFQVHKWIGLILAVLILPISLTGSALVWHEPLERVLNPARFAVSGGTMIDPERYVQAARAVLGKGERIVSLTMPEQGGPVIIAAAQPGKAVRGGPPTRTMLYLDPPSARLLEKANSGEGILRVFHVLHGSLLVPGVGRQIVGWIGVAMMLSCFTGLWLWWPTVGRWARGLRWRRHPNTDTNLHHLLGFWVALPLFMLSLTGAWISFPQFFAGMSGGGGAQRGAAGPDRAALARAKPIAAPKLTLGTAISSTRAVQPGDIRQITWPTDLKPDWTITFAGASRASVLVGDADGVAKLAPPRAGGGQNATARLMRRLHDGTDMGIVWQVLIFIGGILPAVLAVTGIIMWWRARGWKAALKARQVGKRAVVAAE